jgi:dipeptidyl aminopeptidase/acylaminoacyl peptidase
MSTSLFRPDLHHSAPAPRHAGWLLALACAVLAPLSAPAQTPAQAQSPAAQRPLTYADADAWRSIATPVLSRNGQWLAYSAQPQSGDGELVARELASGKERREAVGMLPPPVTTPNEENPDAPPVPRAIRVLFSSDSRFVVASTYPSQAETLAARKARTRPDDMPKGGLLIVDLQSSGAALRVPRVKSLALPAKGGAWLAYLKEAPVGQRPATAAAPAASAASASAAAPSAAPSAAPAGVAASASAAGAAPAGASAAARKEYGTELVVRDLAAGTERRFADVLEMAWSRDGQVLVYTVSGRDEAANGVYALRPQDGSAPVALLAGKGRYSKLVWDRTQAQLAFVSDRDDAAAKVPAFKAYVWARGNAAAVEKLSSAAPGVPAGQVVSDKGALGFSRDGSRLFVPVAPPAKPPREPNAGPTDEDRVVADLWRWNDDLVQPMQKVRSVVERNRSFRGVLDLASNSYVQVADESLRTVSFSDDGQRALGLDDRAYRRRVDYDGGYADVHVVDTRTGRRMLALKQQRVAFNGTLPGEQWSPDGRWVLFFQDGQWKAIDTQTAAVRTLTTAMQTRLANELHDAPGPAQAYGTAGWTSDNSAALVYDRYDIWQVFVDGRAPRNLTLGEGRRTQTRFVVQRIDAVDEDDDERGIDTAKPLTLRGESEATRASGFLRTRFDATMPPQRLVWGDSNRRYVGRARDADVLLSTASRFDTFPELQTSDASFAGLQTVTDVGAQKKPFLWGSNALMPFKNARGVPLQALVYRPPGFDPAKKYPVIVYIYERLSQNLHNFSAPTPNNGINPALYTSNGYVLLMPDIAYTVGQPGQSALDAVLPAIDALVKQGGIDTQRIGIQGHSWGGYQIAWMLTRTNRFRVAQAGAPVGNMTSAYSGIRWGSGLPRQFQYEQGQSRIGPPLLKGLPLYIANSPVFHVDKISTPLLILANDADDAVPWYQGIELFLALRRLEKEAYLFNYNGQLHNLRRRADQKDFAQRMLQFFDHFLKGAPAPAWMRDGIPFNDREDEKERFQAALQPAAAPPAAP